MPSLKLCATELIPPDIELAVLSMNLPVLAATRLAAVKPVFASPVNALLAVLAAELNALKMGRLGVATSSAGSGDECTIAINAHNTTTDKVVFMLIR